MNKEEENTQNSQKSQKRSIRPTPKSREQEEFNKTNKSGSNKNEEEKFGSSRNSKKMQMSSGGFDKFDNREQVLVVNEGRLEEYEEDEDGIVCNRFPHLDFCACQQDCKISADLIQVIPNLFIGDFATGLTIKKMLAKGITHVLNVTATEYKKRTKYFRYLTIDVYDKSDEDIKKHFRITNRFIKDCIQGGGKVLIQDLECKSIAPSFALAYLINNQKTPLKQGYDLMRSICNSLELSPNFNKQLERYDLEKLALVTLKKKEQ